MYYFAGYVLKFIFSLFGRIKIYQKENLPTSGGYVVACTHTGWVDILWLGIALLPIKIHYMAKKELFQSPMLRWLIESLHAFPVDRENPGPSAIKIPRKLLKEGKIVGIFPSGTRTTEEVPLKRGAVTIASSAKVPLIPVVYEGPNNFSELFKRKRPKIIYGSPIYLDQNLPKKEGIEKMTNDLNTAFAELKEKLANKK